MTISDERELIQFHYTFRFSDGSSKVFNIDLHSETLEINSDVHGNNPAWTLLSYHQCENCPLSSKIFYCPIAVNLSKIVEEFKSVLSYEKTFVTVVTPQRTFQKETTVQKGLSSIIGIYMATSNCPIFDQLRPMIRFHLPFATMLETMFRAVSFYLTSQYFSMLDGGTPDWELNKLKEIYRQVSIANKGISKRISAASPHDANINAVIILHSYGEMIELFINNGLKDIRPFFEKGMK
jgi:hypothetical protein